MKCKDKSLSEFATWLTSPAPRPRLGGNDELFMPREPGYVLEINETALGDFREDVPPDSPTSCVMYYDDSSSSYTLVFRRGQKFLARLLSDEEAYRFCELAGILFRCKS
jgi:hypothetical protein